MKSKEQEI